MADEKIGISVEVKGTGAGIKSVKELKNEVQKLEETASKADFGSDEFKKATEEANKLKGKMTEISGAETTKMNTSLKGLQQEYKKLKVALSEAANPEEFKRLSKELNDVEGKIGDINDAANIATGSGVEQLNKGIALVGEGFRNFDFEKIKIGFKGIGNAMSAAAPLLLVAAIGALIENFGAIVEFVKTATGTWSDEEIAVKRATKAYETQTKVTTELVTQYDNELKILEAQGASEKKILEVKKLKILAQIQQLKASVAVQEATIKEIQANDDLSESLSRATAWVQRKLGNEQAALLYEATIQFEKNERIKEEQEKKEEALRTISSLEADLVVLQINNDKKVAESNKKTSEERRKIAEDDAKFLREKNNELLTDYNNYEKAKQDAEKKAAEGKSKAEDLAIEAEIQADQKKFEADKKKRELDLADYKKVEAAKMSARQALEKASFDAAKGLSDAIFSIQIGNAKKGSAEELKLKKQQFNINKAFAVTQAIIDGRRAIQTVLASYPAPFNIPIAIATGISSAANIAKIASAKFDGGGASGGESGGGSAPQIGSTSLPTPPTINTPNNNTSTMFDEQGNNLGQSNDQRTAQPIKVFVTETDISEIQNRANKLKTQTTI